MSFISIINSKFYVEHVRVKKSITRNGANMQKNINLFIEQLLQANSLPDVDVEVKTDLVNELRKRLVQFINIQLISALPSKSVPKFEALLKSNPTNQSLSHFIKENVQDREKIISDAMINFRTIYLNAYA